MGEFSTVFFVVDEVNKLLFTSQPPLIIAVFIVFLSFIVLIFAIKGKLLSLRNGIVVFGVSLMLFVMSFADYLERKLAYQELAKIYYNEQYNVVEGIVDVYHVQPHSGHDKGDIINIGDVAFEVNCYSSTFGYNQTITHGGVLREREYAKVYYYDEIILRVDIRDFDEQKSINRDCY